MTCETVEPLLLDFQFGTVDDAARVQVESHLLECGRCLKIYWELKRHLETAEGAPAPSLAARSKLRAAVVEHLHPVPRPWRWWERPLAFGFATAALVAAVVVTHQVAVAPVSPPKSVGAAAKN